MYNFMDGILVKLTEYSSESAPRFIAAKFNLNY